VADRLAKYDIAQICTNGHVINNSHERFREFSVDYCTECGAKTTTECANCKTPIRGAYSGSMRTGYDRPAYCHNCGEPYPWTSAALAAAMEFATDLQQQIEREKFAEIIENLVKDSPSTSVAAAKLRGLMGSMKPYASEALRQILTGVVTEGAKRILWPSAGK